MTTKQAMMSKTSQIIKVLEHRYPCGEIPHGHQVKIAQEFGVSRELVRQIAFKKSYQTISSAQNRALPYVCVCGKPKKTPSLCYSCRWVEIPCANCGKPKRIKASEYARRFAKPHPYGFKRTERVFCDRVCQGVWLGVFHKPAVVQHKTICKRGHDLTDPNNVYVGPNERRCKPCRRLTRRGHRK